MTVIYCSRCLMPSTRPRIRFTDGVCNACLFAEEQRHVDWEARRQEFGRVVESHGAHGAYDCVVPLSGGKDSATIAHRLKHEFGLNPLGVCYGQLLWTDVGRRNFERVCRSGIDIHYWRVNQEVSRQLARRFFIERGHPKNAYAAAVNAVPLITAVQFNIPLVFYAEHGESAYGGLVLDKESQRTRNLTEVLEHQVGDDARNWARDGITERDLFPYIYPDKTDIERVGVKAFYWSYFFKWDIYQNAQYAREKMGFETAYDGMTHGHPLPDWWGRSDGSFEGFDSIDDQIDTLDFYMCYPKFLFGRSTRMASRLIQGGHMTREQGLQLVKQYDGEFPRTYLPEILDYLGMNERELRATIDLHRNDELWKNEGNGWEPRYKP
ncbi:MAG: N-acetyl sugar amidotransferase [Desulfobacteraceae bacterium]|nr:MAG: N-acetyl sugar amidotransferase [Desulfobacteraceae bacterium]